MIVMPETYSISEFAERYRFRDRREVTRYIALGVVKPIRIHGNSRLVENDMLKIAEYNTNQRIKNNQTRRIIHD